MVRGTSTVVVCSFCNRTSYMDSSKAVVHQVEHSLFKGLHVEKRAICDPCRASKEFFYLDATGLVRYNRVRRSTESDLSED